MLVRHIRFCYKKIKCIEPEPWIVRPSDASKDSLRQDLSHLNVKYYREVKREFSRKR